MSKKPESFSAQTLPEKKSSISQAQAQQFTTGFKQAIWSAPEYDYTLVNPTRREAISAKNQAALQHETADLAALADQAAFPGGVDRCRGIATFMAEVSGCRL